jgi:UDP-N-acetylglucosamine 3-dehydrogenase
MNSDRKIKVGILSFAHMHATSYAEELKNTDDVELVGIWDVDTHRGKQMSEAYGAPYFPNISALLDLGLDGVIIASENINHKALVEASANAGVKVILCEKPLATTSDDAAAMVKFCDAAGTKLLTAFPCRHSPAFQSLRAQVAAGKIGDVLAIRGTNRGSNPGGWFVDKEQSGGGAIMDHTVHVADLIWLLLNKPAISVYAESGNGFYHQDWEDTGFLTIGYEGGIFATLDTSWSRPKSYPTWGDVTLQVIGTGGVLELDLLAQYLDHYDDRSGRVAWNYWGSSFDGGLIAEFVDLCCGKESNGIATGKDGLRAVEIVAAAYASTKTNQPAAVKLLS